MIITLSSSFSQLSVDEWRPYLAAVENLIASHLQGWHYFIPDRASAEALIAHPDLSGTMRDTLSVAIAERLTVLQGYAKSTKVRIVCEQDNESRPVGLNEVRAELKRFVDLDNCMKCKLIVENAENDAKFYISAAEASAAVGSLVPSLSFEIVAGGGHTTAHRIAEAILSVRPSVAIIDSDRTHPNSSEGDTAKAARLAFPDGVTGNHRLIVTQVRSLENFIPFSLAAGFLEDSVAKKRAAALAAWQAKELEEEVAPEECITAFYGAKKGLKIKAFRTGSEKFRKTIVDLCTHLGETFVAPALNDNTKDNAFAVIPLARDYAALFVRLIDEKGFSAFAKEIGSSPFANELTEIAGLIVAFGAAPLKSASRIAA